MICIILAKVHEISGIHNIHKIQRRVTYLVENRPFCHVQRGVAFRDKDRISTPSRRREFQGFTGDMVKQQRRRQLADVSCIGNDLDSLKRSSCTQWHLSTEDVRTSDNDRSVSSVRWSVQVIERLHFSNNHDTFLFARCRWDGVSNQLKLPASIGVNVVTECAIVIGNVFQFIRFTFGCMAARWALCRIQRLCSTSIVSQHPTHLAALVQRQFFAFLQHDTGA